MRSALTRGPRWLRASACSLQAHTFPRPHSNRPTTSPQPPSFAVVIQQLPNPLRDAICVFYLVLRGLDTVEDDMAIPDKTKIPDLLKFHE